MKILCRLILIFLFLLGSISVSGQSPYIPNSLKHPSFAPFSHNLINKYLEISKGMWQSGDLEGLASNIEILNDLNIYADPHVSAAILNLEGILKYYKSNISQALQCYLRALAFYDEVDDTEGRPNIMNNIAIIFAGIEDYESTTKYLQKALAHIPENDIAKRSTYMLNLAETESLRKNYNTGISIANELLDSFDPSVIDFSEIAVYGILINCYTYLNKDEEAQYWIDKGLRSIQENSTYLDRQAFIKGVIEYYYNRKNYEKVLEYGKMIYPPPDESYLHELYEIIDYMARSARANGDLREAFNLSQRANEIELSIAPITPDEIINPLMIQYSNTRDINDRDLIYREFQENNIRSQKQRKFLIHLCIISIILVISLIILSRTRTLRIGYQRNLEQKNIKLNEIHNRLETNNIELEKENRILDTLISVFAHDLINPFQSILGFSHLMMDENSKLSKENFIEYTGLLAETSFQLNQLLVNLQGLAIVQDERRNLNSSNFALRPALMNIVKLFDVLLKNKSISISTKNCESVILNVNRDVFDAVIRNVISNAIKYSDKDSTIDIYTNQSKDIVTLSVKDSGIGMTESIKTELLTKNHLESRPGTLNEKGSGFGLTVCIDLLELAGGSLQIESKEYVGSTISINLPLANE